MDAEIKTLINELIYSFTSDSCDNSKKWLLLNIYHDKYLAKKDFDKTLKSSYPSVLSTLLDGLHVKFFHEKWHETLFDNIFLHGILHESFLILIKRLEHRDKYVKLKVLNVLQKFVRCPILENLLLFQCFSSKNWNLIFVSKSNVWDLLITALASLPDRIANETEGKNVKVFCPAYYIPLLLSTIFKALHSIYASIKNSQDCSLEFLAKLTGRICLRGKADIVAKMYLKVFLGVSESDYVWRRISQNFVSKMPSNVLDSFITNMLLQIPWYGYVEWILGDEGMRNSNLNYIMTLKLLFVQSFKSAAVLQNIIGYFASSPERVSVFIKILDSLLDSWADERALRHQSTDQQIYLASALMIGAGWLQRLQPPLNSGDCINKVLKGTQIRLGKAEEAVRSLAMVVGGHLTQAFDSSVPALQYECPDADLLNHLKNMLEIPSKPDDSTISFEDLEYFVTVTQSNSSVEETKEVSSDDDLESFDLSNDIPESKAKRPLYLRDCMAGLIQQHDPQWNEACLRHAEQLIKASPYATEEVAEEMAKVMLHLTDNSSISDFVGLRHKILITLTVQCPLVVSAYLTSQFTEKDYTIRQRLDILEVLAASSALLAYSGASDTCPIVSRETSTTRESEWQLIIRQRLEAKTKHYTKAQELSLKENRFSAIAGNLFFPLLNSHEKACQILKLHGEDSYVLGRFIHTLGVIMFSASNTLHCSRMGSSLLHFLYSVRKHEDAFVRKSVLFAVAATYTAVPASILFTDMLQDVTGMTNWLHNVVENDFDPNCVEKAMYTLSIYQNAAAEGSLLLQLKHLRASD